MNISINHILYISLHCPAPARLLRAKGAKVAITSTTDRIFGRFHDKVALLSEQFTDK
jgi:hypothetical protein